MDRLAPSLPLSPAGSPAAARALGSPSTWGRCPGVDLQIPVMVFLPPIGHKAPPRSDHGPLRAGTPEHVWGEDSHRETDAAVFGERGAAPSPRVLLSTTPSPGMPFPSAQAPFPPAMVACALPSAESLRAARPRHSPMVSPGEVFVTVVEVQDFIVSERGRRPPMWATIGLSEWPRLR